MKSSEIVRCRVPQLASPTWAPVSHIHLIDPSIKARNYYALLKYYIFLNKKNEKREISVYNCIKFTIGRTISEFLE